MTNSGTMSLFGDSPFTYADRFLEDHAGRIISDPRIAVVELVANAYDAGATEVKIIWPDARDEEFSIADNGSGLTRAELEHRWKSFNYDRIREQGAKVTPPPGVTGMKRTAFGQSGKGRHAPFCFADTYSILTTKDEIATSLTVSKSAGAAPFQLDNWATEAAGGHGTEIRATLQRNRIEPEEIRQLIGAKFLVDPTFHVSVNGTPVELVDLEGLETTELDTLHGPITVYFIDTTENSRTGKLRGIAWWCNNRMVGEPSWQRLDDDGTYIDGKRKEAKRYSFVIHADILKPEVKQDWAGFHSGKKLQDVHRVVHDFVLDKLQSLLAAGRRERKMEALSGNLPLLKELPAVSKKAVVRFIDEVQEKCPSISDRDLNRTVEILSRLEQSRWQYDLLKDLAKSTPEDLDKWTLILKQWSASSAELVLGELDRRVTLINRMEQLVEDPNADELHQLQPLFERGLWIFGTEYEAVDFRSNRGLTEVIRRFLGSVPGAGDMRDDYDQPTRRIDLIALPDRSIGAYAADSYEAGEVAGIRKVLIIELKRGGFALKQGEADQARDYAKEIKRSGRVQKETEIEVFVLGAEKEDDLVRTELPESRITVVPRVYNTVLQQARLRTFNLQSKLKELAPPSLDPDVDRMLKNHPTLV